MNSNGPHGIKDFSESNALNRFIRFFAGTRLGAALFRPTAHHLDELVSKLSRGKLSFVGLASGLPVVILTTLGAKSREPRTVAVLGIPYADGLGLIASNWGDSKHPGWYHNLKANPEGTVTVGAETWTAVARQATSRERDEIWAKGVVFYPAWSKYEDRTGGRHIEAFVLARK
ncbi:nitroreductase family deazaflavin-dependent oxidoreductase [Mycobacterium sp. Aquia_213]|uniref:nitroreductase family deazaflavin-dependent oxidoreductase n=1 Tax=Mycobacterium sp. Aquia_213 TaxID=2991728 RepID=UPI00227134B3|nr:nitroreductase family deazaflavin-dependent oxidoreductase [Mycobacterium sp. Aquia_213]WAC92625.1 nitroreductase family deazaflavin-dependent oxidoreductase [Mycobacterium sp. Aquia_213]